MDDGSRGAVFEQLARVGKALGSGSRLELIELLAQGERGVVELAEAAGLKVTTASAHLQTLRHAGLVSTERDGTTIRYRLAGSDVAALYTHLLAVATAHSAEVDAARRRLFGDDDIQAIDRAELLRRLDAGESVLLDVRPEREFQAGHIPGAVSIPLAELADRLAELPADQEVVAYCRGAFCELSHDAVRLLTARGWRATRLADGIVEWRIAGHPLTTG